MGRWGRSPAHSFWQICTSVWMWMDPQAAPESTCLDPHPTTHGAHPPTSHWGGLIKPGQLTSVHTVARHSFLLSFESQSHCLWNESNIHPLQQARWKSRNFSLCGKGGILGGRSGTLGPGGWITNAALYAQMFLSGRRDLGKYAKNYGGRVTFNFFTTDPGVPKKNVIVPPFQNVD